MSTPLFTHFRRAATVGGLILGLSCHHALAGVQAAADKEVTQQQVAADEAFPLHFGLSFGGDSEFVFRGVDILPEVNINESKLLTEAINGVPAKGAFPSFKDFLAGTKFKNAQAFVNSVIPASQPVTISHENGIYYVDGNVSAYNFTVGAFYGTQTGDRVDRSALGSKPFFDSYHEFDAYVRYAHAFGPVQVSLGGTFYHVVNNSDFDTAELNFGVSYTPPQFHYVSASFTYNYAGAFNFNDYSLGTVHGEYLDGHYLELRVDGNVPLYKHVIEFDPYALVSAGSGIVPRAFNPLSLPTYFNTKRFAEGFEPTVAAFYYATLQNAEEGKPPPDPKSLVVSAADQAAAAQAFDPKTLDRSFDLSNFQIGFRVPFYLTRHLTIRGDFNYSRPLGNLDREPYNQYDEIYGGGTITYSF